jgi:hypothetical protein
MFGDYSASVKADENGGVNDNKAQVSAAGVPARRDLRPSRHQQAILRRLARPGAYAYARIVERAEDDGSAVIFDYESGAPIREQDCIFCYENGEQILDYYGCPMGPDEFGYLRQFLVAVPSEDNVEVRWIARRTTTEPDFSESRE